MRNTLGVRICLVSFNTNRTEATCAPLGSGRRAHLGQRPLSDAFEALEQALRARRVRACLGVLGVDQQGAAPLIEGGVQIFAAVGDAAGFEQRAHVAGQPAARCLQVLAGAAVARVRRERLEIQRDRREGIAARLDPERVAVEALGPHLGLRRREDGRAVGPSSLDERQVSERALVGTVEGEHVPECTFCVGQVAGVEPHSAPGQQPLDFGVPRRLERLLVAGGSRPEGVELAQVLEGRARPGEIARFEAVAEARMDGLA